jgi:hypothetical protein
MAPERHAQPWLATPLQLSSLPATHVSDADGVMLQLPQAPPPHVSVPLAHLPTRLSAEHARVWPLMQAQPSFVLPLQLSSLPEAQVSEDDGVMLQPLQLPPEHVCVPPAHLPK